MFAFSLTLVRHNSVSKFDTLVEAFLLPLHVLSVSLLNFWVIAPFCSPKFIISGGVHVTI